MKSGDMFILQCRAWCYSLTKPLPNDHPPMSLEKDDYVVYLSDVKPASVLCKAITKHGVVRINKSVLIDIELNKQFDSL